MIGCPCEVCHSQDPRDKRLRSSILVQSDQTVLVVDTTPDFRTQMLREHVMHLDAVLITHSHKDHIAGLDDVKAYNFFQQHTMHVYASEATQLALQREFYYIFQQEKYPGIPDVTLHTISTRPLTVGDIPVIPIWVHHFKMPVLGFRFGNFTYITDANHIDEEEKEKIKGSEVLVVNALRKKEHLSHFTLQQAVDLAEELAIPQAYLTHISHQMGFHQDINKELPSHIRLAWDGLSLSIG